MNYWLEPVGVRAWKRCFASQQWFVLHKDKLQLDDVLLCYCWGAPSVPLAGWVGALRVARRNTISSAALDYQGQDDRRATIDDTWYSPRQGSRGKRDLVEWALDPIAVLPLERGVRPEDYSDRPEVEPLRRFARPYPEAAAKLIVDLIRERAGGGAGAKRDTMVERVLTGDSGAAAPPSRGANASATGWLRAFPHRDEGAPSEDRGAARGARSDGSSDPDKALRTEEPAWRKAFPSAKREEAPSARGRGSVPPMPWGDDDSDDEKGPAEGDSGGGSSDPDRTLRPEVAAKAEVLAKVLRAEGMTEYRALQKRLAVLLLDIDGFLPIEAFRSLLRSVRAYNSPNFTLNMRKDSDLFKEAREREGITGWKATPQGRKLGAEMAAKVAGTERGKARKADAATESEEATRTIRLTRGRIYALFHDAPETFEAIADLTGVKTMTLLNYCANDDLYARWRSNNAEVMDQVRHRVEEAERAGVETKPLSRSMQVTQQLERDESGVPDSREILSWGRPGRLSTGNKHASPLRDQDVIRAIKRDGRFEGFQYLGHGGFGTVYRARDSRTGERVAIKVLTGMTQADRQRFVHEIFLQEGLNHAHVLSARPHGIAGQGGLWYAMPYCRRGSLASLLRRGPMPPTDAVEFMSRVGEGLAYLHEQGIVHRDFKPDNILIGDNDTPKIADFGISKIKSLRSVTVASTLGTPGYMAPEQEIDFHAADARSDIYSFGVVLYECLTGEGPREGVFKPTQHARLGELGRIVRKMHSTEPSDRPASMREVLQDLDAWRRDRP